MRFKGLIQAIGISAVLLGGSVTFTSCSNDITDEQLSMLKELRKKERSLQQQIADTEDDISKLQREINARQSELDDCNDDKAFVKEKLNQWPDVWPDYKQK